jgi:rubrerythrin
MIAKAETWHYDRFIELADNIAKDRIFKREKKIKWRCQNCGYIHEGECPPEKCPACDHAKTYFMVHQAVF